MVHSIILYEAPIWAPAMRQKGKSELAKVQRRTALRVASEYCTISADAILVIANMPPIDLMAMERHNIFENMPKKGRK